jgi:hypothetical protein
MSRNPAANAINLLEHYRPQRNYNLGYVHGDERYAHQIPFFAYNTIPLMLRDARIKYALRLLKGPMFAFTKFFSEEEAAKPGIQRAIQNNDYYFSYVVKSESKETADFVLKTLKRFWVDGLFKALRAIEWGFSPNQIIYERDKDGKIVYKSLSTYDPMTCNPMSKHGKLTGFYVERQHKRVRFPKAFIHIHQRDIDPFLGCSRLRDAHLPWHENWTRGGARDVRRNWFYRCSYDSGTLYFPTGESIDKETGEARNNMDIALEIMHATVSGSYRVLPCSDTVPGKDGRLWQFEEPTSRRSPDGLDVYGDDLKNEYFEGMGIPPEVVEADSSGGMGSSTGRKVPFLAFLASLAPMVSEVLTDVDNQILRTLVELPCNNLSDEYSIEQIIPEDGEEEEQEIPDPLSSRDSQTETSA